MLTHFDLAVPQIYIICMSRQRHAENIHPSVVWRGKNQPKCPMTGDLVKGPIYELPYTEHSLLKGKGQLSAHGAAPRAGVQVQLDLSIPPTPQACWPDSSMSSLFWVAWEMHRAGGGAVPFVGPRNKV